MAKKAKLPKKIAGVKVPKKLRKGGGSLLALIESPIGRRVAADALIAVAGVLAGNDRTRGAVAAAGREVADAGEAAASGSADVARQVAEVATGVVAEAARHVLPASLTGEDERSRRSRDADVVRHVGGRNDKKAKDRDKPSKH